MKVCFLLGGFTKLGGIGRVTSIIANEINKNENIDLSVISFTNRHLENLYQLDDGINHFYLFDTHINMTSAMFKNATGKLGKILKEEKIDILVACGAMFYPVSLFSAIGLDTKVVCWEHSNVQNTKGYRFQKQARWLGAKFADCIVALTEKDKHSYERVFKINNVHRIYNPVDENINLYRREYSPDSKKIISVGRLSYQKNFQNLIEVASTVLSNYPEWSWDIYGEGEDFEELETLIHSNNLKKQVVLKGRVDNLYELYNEYSFLVMTSRFEGFPMTLLEGMAFGLPLISYNILTGPNEIIEDGVNGYLIEHQNADRMAASIEALIMDRDQRIKMSSENLEKRNNYSLESIIEQWESLFNNLIEE